MATAKASRVGVSERPPIQRPVSIGAHGQRFLKRFVQEQREAMRLPKYWPGR